METELLLALLGGVGGMLGWGLADFFAKKTIDQAGDIASLTWAHIFGTLVFVGLVMYRFLAYGQKIAIPNEPKAWLGLLFFGFLQAIVYFFVYKGFGKGQVAVLSPVFASFSGLVALFSIIFFSEVVTGYGLVALAVVFGGILLINTDPKALIAKSLNFVEVPGFKEVALAALLAAFWTLGWDRFVGGQDWISYAMFMYAAMTLVILIIAKFQKVRLSGFKPNLYLFFVLIGASEAVGYTAISLGYSATAHTSIVALLSGAFSLPTMILARIFLKERVNAAQTIGSGVIVAGIMLLALVQ